MILLREKRKYRTEVRTCGPKVDAKRLLIEVNNLEIDMRVVVYRLLPVLYL